MKRQNIRMLLLIISLLLFPVTLYYFSPYLIVLGASQGIITGSFIVFSLMLFSSIFLGRVFCGWICPAGGIQECLIYVNDKQAKGGKLNWIKYMIWLPWISIISVLFFYAGGFNSIDVFYQTTHGISVIDIMGYIIYYGVLFLIVILAVTTGKRGFCHYTCWMAPFMIIGTKFRRQFRIPSLQIKADTEKCISCNKCTNKCPMSLDVLGMVQKSDMNNDECILCGECIDICPKSVIHYGIKPIH